MFMPDWKRVARMAALTLVAIALGAGGADGTASMIAQRGHAAVASDFVVARHFDAYNRYRALVDSSSEPYVCSPRMLLV